MKVFVTGATGYLGSVVVEQLRAAGHEILALARSEKAADRLTNLGLAVQQGELADSVSLARGVEQAEATIHLAASRTPRFADLEREAVGAMLEALVNSGKKFIFTSGLSVYGDTGDATRAEDEPPLPDHFRAEMERFVLSYARRGVQPVVIRPGYVYGRGGGVLSRAVDHALETGAAGVIGSGTVVWPFIHVDDLAKLYAQALALAPAGGVYHGVAGESLSFRAVAEQIATANRLPGALVHWSLKEARAVLGPIAAAFTTNLRVSAEKTRRELAWRPQASSIFEEIDRGSYHPSPYADDRKNLVHRFTQLIKKRDVESFGQVIAPDYKQHNPMVQPGLAGIKQGMYWFLQVFPDLEATLESLIAEGDQVVGRFTWTGTQAGPFMDLPATGKQITWGSIDWWRVEQGRLAEHWDQVDWLGLTQQLTNN